VTSAYKTESNRANARSSTGPKTAEGRARSARNARRHGLSLPVLSDPVCSQEVDELAHQIAGANANAEIQELARRIAEAQIDLRRVRRARQALLSSENLMAKPEGPTKFATILYDMAWRLAAMDRYERRALSRRKFAIQVFDAARRKAASMQA
jgi:hypothetical protein